MFQKKIKYPTPWDSYKDIESHKNCSLCSIKIYPQYYINAKNNPHVTKIYYDFNKIILFIEDVFITWKNFMIGLCIALVFM